MEKGSQPPSGSSNVCPEVTARGFAAPSPLLGGGGIEGSIAGSALAARSVWQPNESSRGGSSRLCSAAGRAAPVQAALLRAPRALPAIAAPGSHCIAPPIPSPDFVSVNRVGFVPPLHVTANRRCGTSAASELQHKAATDFQRLTALTSQELRSALIDGFQANTMDPELSIQRETHNASARYVTLLL